MVDVNRITTPANMRWKLVDRDTGDENAAIDWRFKLGDQVKIRLLNEMAGDHPMHHPFHVHGAGRFLVLSRDDVPESNLVWKDTVLVRTGETVEHGRLARPYQHRVLPDEVGLGHAVAAQDEEAARPVDVERMVHRVVAGHLVEQPDLHLVADAEAPVDRRVFGVGVAVDELPAHVRWGGHPIDVDHVVFPLDATGRGVVVAFVLVVVTLVSMSASGVDESGRHELHLALRAVARLVAHDLGMHRARVTGARRRDRQQLHPALRAAAGLVADHLRVHGAGVDDRAFRRLHVHLGDEGECLVRLCVEIGGDPLALGDHVGVRAEDFELLRVRRLDPLVAHVDGGQRVDALRRAVLERQVAGLVEQDVHDHTLGGSEDDILDELLVLDVAAVAADELHARARQRDLERPGVRGVREVEAHDLAELRVQ